MTIGLALGAATAKADQAPGEAPPSTLAPADYKAVKCLHAMSELYVSAGTLAEKHGGTHAVRDFGATLVSDHEAADQQLLAYAKKAGIDPNRMSGEAPPIEMAKYVQRVDRLRTLTGPEFDRELAVTMQDAHERALALIQRAVPDIFEHNLAVLLEQQLPTLEKNREAAALLVSQTSTGQ